MEPSATPEPGLLTLTELAELGGTTTSAVRYYERTGLIESQQTTGDRRGYPTRMVFVVRAARLIQRVGYSASEARDMLDRLPQDPSPEDWQGLTDFLVSDAERRVSELQDVLAELRSDRRIHDLP
ncbi:MerR family transcriptional regulator [Nocardioides sp. CPCC 205120]|uniref:MerR family transcriptional regulator n=1 Tax=Nocardioides sp. CPCC 205120 TaxID=3406462 RepID=UPI003B50F91C